MLISVMATALILMAGTESSLKGNYKSAMQAFYSAKAGLEEGRGRLWAGSAQRFATPVFPSTNTAMLPGQAAYIVNPSAGETVDPTDPSNPYFDSEFQQEWGSAPSTSAPKLPSTSPGASLAGPLYKWVRIAARTEASAGLDVNGDATVDSANPLFYDGKQQLLSSSAGTSVPGAAHAWQVYTITALAVTPGPGLLPSRRMVQYTVATAAVSGFTLPAALTLQGTTPTYQGQSYSGFFINGSDRSGHNLTSCVLPSQPPVAAIGVMHNSYKSEVGAAIPVSANYTGAEAPTNDGRLGLPPTPDVEKIVSFIPSSFQSPQDYENFVSALTSLATESVSGGATSLPNYGTAANPVVAVVDGDLTLSGNVTGYGILVVRGNFNFSGTVGWRGIVLVIGNGVINASGVGSNEFDGAIFVATTLDSSGNVLSTFGSPQVNWNTGGGGPGTSIGAGVYYDSCWINNAWAALPYEVLSFREIPQ